MIRSELERQQEQVEFAWQFAESDEAWQAHRDAITTPAHVCRVPANPLRALRSRAAAAVYSLLLLIVCGGYFVWRQAEAGLDAVESELQQTVLLEALADQPKVGVLGESLLDPQLAPSWRRVLQPYGVGMTAEPNTNHGAPSVHVEEFDLRGEYAMARVTVSEWSPAGELASYRETRFYRQTAAGWRRTAPDQGLIGPWLASDTDHFTIRHHRLDREPVLAAASGLDALYHSLRQDLGLTHVDGTPKIRLELVTPDPSLNDWLNQQRVAPMQADPSLRPPAHSGRSYPSISVPSMALLPVPVEFSEATALQHAIVFPLTGVLLEETFARQPQPWQQTASTWEPVLRALRLWEMWQSAGPLSIGREELVAWLYANAQEMPGQALDELPAAYNDICQNYRLWRLYPLQASLPLSCTTQEQDFLLALRLPTRLTYLIPSGDDCRCPDAEPVAGTVALASMIDYAVTVYGRYRLPLWVDALGEYQSWESLIPAVFGVPAADFESGWQAYLADHYSVLEIR